MGLHLDVSAETKPVPADWSPDCANCAWHLANCDRLYLFQSVFDGDWHVNGRPFEESTDGL